MRNEERKEKNNEKKTNNGVTEGRGSHCLKDEGCVKGGGGGGDPK